MRWKKKKNLMGQDKDSLRKQSKGRAWKQRKTKDLFSTSHQQAMSSHFPRSRASVYVVVALENKHCNKEFIHYS